ncbi:MAG: DUF819 family protein [Bacteroidota bacterium]
MTALIVQILLIVLGPYLGIQLVRRLGVDRWLSPVIIAYALGMIVGNLPGFSIDTELAHQFSEVTVLLAIPLLLFSTDIPAWLRHAPQTLLAFGLCVLSGLVASTVVAFNFPLEGFENWMVSGMLVGVYTGGTPNMQAIGMALNAGEEVYVLLNAADIFCGGLYLLFLVSVAHRFLGWFLPDFEGDRGLDSTEGSTAGGRWRWLDLGMALGLTLLIIGTSLGLVWALTGGLKASSWIILLLTAGSIAASFSPRVRSWRGAFEAGEYFLLMFCVAIGSLSNFQEMLAGSTSIIPYTASVLLLTVALHFALSALFRIDRDTTLITSTAALYGPVFIGQIASVIGNRTLVFSGMATGLIGYALGNFLGIGMAALLQLWL